MYFLDLTGTEAQRHIDSSAEPPIQKVTVGAAVLRHNSQGDAQILLLKRSAHEKCYPNVFEMPGGKVDTGETLRAALTREVNEKSGLVVSRILKPFATFNYTTTKTVNEEVLRRYAQKFSYILAVEGDGSDSRIRQAEHSEGS